MLEVNSQRHINMSIIHGSQRLTSANKQKINIGDKVIIDNGPNKESGYGIVVDKQDGEVIVKDIYEDNSVKMYENFLCLLDFAKKYNTHIYTYQTNLGETDNISSNIMSKRNILHSGKGKERTFPGLVCD